MSTDELGALRAALTAQSHYADKLKKRNDLYIQIMRNTQAHLQNDLYKNRVKNALILLDDALSLPEL
jgi:hypothetical protein